MNGQPDMDALLKKIARLLDTRGRDEAEAALYVAKAHALLQQYDLDMEAVAGSLEADKRSSVGEGDTTSLVRRGKPEGWKYDLFLEVARSVDCRVMLRSWMPGTGSGKYGILIGHKLDIEVAGYTFDYLVAELTRLADAYGKERSAEIWAYAAETGISKHDAERNWTYIHGTHPLRAKLSWLRGATESVIQTLRTEKRNRTQTSDATMALVVNKKAQVEDYLREKQAKMYGKTLAEYDAWIAQMAEERRTAVVVKPKPETPAQARKRAEREARQSERDNERYDREQDKRDRATDWDALDRGRRDGAAIGIRRGVKGATGTTGEIA